MANRSDVRRTGAVYTPDNVAASIVDYLGPLPPGPLRVLEPSVGDGAFIAHLPLPSSEGHSCTLVDIDPDVINQLRERRGAPPSNYVVADFCQFAMKHLENGHEPFDLIIGNPPFIRKHNFSNEFKNQIADFARFFEYPVSSLKNSWAFFMIASIHLLSEAGVIAFVLPYEIMTVKYGQALLEFAASKLARIDIFISEVKAFKDIDQDAIVFIGRSITDEPGLFVNQVQNLSDLKSPRVCRIKRDNDSDLSLELSSFLISPDAMSSLRQVRQEASVISSFADSAPGVVSAANNFFILTDTDADHLGLRAQTVPILKKGSLAGTSPIFNLSDFERLAEKEPCRLLVIRGERSTLEEPLQSYIGVGEKLLLQDRYKCRNRSRWYEVPLVSVEDGFFFKRSHSFPRIIVNEAGVYITDTAYGIRVRAPYTIRGLCFSFYSILTLLFAEIDGRFYGGGVLELSPTEFRRLPIVYHEPSEKEWQEFLRVHELAAGQVEPILDFGDSWLQSKGKFSADQLKMMRSTWSTIRAHRMRHGGR